MTLRIGYRAHHWVSVGWMRCGCTQSILILLILAVAHPAQNFLIDDAGAADAATTFDSGLPHFN